MGLSDNLISQFAKLTVGDKKVRSESTVFGTVVDYADSKYVQIDGSELLTPVSSTTDIIDGDRVTVLIKDHSATIMGNLTSPAARLEHVEVVEQDVEGVKKEIAEFDTVIAKKVEAEVGKFDEIIVGKVDAAIIEADLVTTEYLSANYITAEKINAKFAEIETLDVETLNAKYAQIDFANIGEAAIEKLFSDSGIIKDLVMKDGAITGELDAVTINGDLINANTLKADRLVVKGKDGLYYRLNINGVGEGEVDENGITVEQTDENSLNGTKIQAKSITASKINVSDLVAFDATIGGFQIDKDSIHSHAKGSTYVEDENGDLISQYDGVHNTNPGIYMDDIGQVAFGDANNYIKYYKDNNDEWKMEFKASEFTFDVSPGVSIGEAIGNTIVLTEEEFYQSSSPTKLVDGEWVTAQPTWTEGKYIWRRTKNTYNKNDENGNPVFDYTPSENGVCITGNTGTDAVTYMLVNIVGSSTSLRTPIVCPVSASGVVKEDVIIPLCIDIEEFVDGERVRSVTPSKTLVSIPATEWKREEITDGLYNVTIPKGYVYDPSEWSGSDQPVIGIICRHPDNGEYIEDCILVLFIPDGQQGPQGPQGDKGDPGVSIKTVTEKYQVSASNTDAPTTWENTAPELTADKPYLWNYEIITYSDDSTSESNQRVIGNFSKDGNPGKGIEEITNYYATTVEPNSSSIASTDWKTTMQVTSVDKPYLWTKEFIKYTDGTSKQTNPIIIGTHGATGPQGPQGTAGVAYSMISNVYAIVKTSAGNYVPESITLDGRSQSGTDTISKYAGRFKIEYTSDNSTWSEGYSSANNENTVTYTIPAGITALRCSFYKAGGFTTKLDEQIISVVSNGLDGDGYTVILTNENHTFAATSTAAVDGGTATCRVMAYKGGSSEAVNIGAIENIPTGMTITITNNNKAQAGFTVKVTSEMTTASGILTIPITVDGKSFEKQFTYSLAFAGEKGDKGDPGDNGKGIKSVTEYYAVSSNSSTAPTSWTTTMQSMTATNKYLWNYEVITYSDDDTYETAKRIIGIYGDTGRGVSNITNYYLATSASSGVTTLTNGWTTTVQSMTATKKYLWNYEVITYTSGNPTTTTPVIIGRYGTDGYTPVKGTDYDDGRGISSFTTYYLASSAPSGVTTSTNGWTTTTQTTTSSKKYLWSYTKTVYTDTSENITTPIIMGTYGDKGDPGKGIKSTAITYQAHTNGTNAPTGTWSTSVPSVSAGYYLWTKTVITYTDDNTSTSYSVSRIGIDGDPGKGIKSTAITYQAHTSGTSTPTGTWSTSVPSVSAGQYLWTKTVITYTDDSTSTSYSVGAMGTSGKGVKSTAVTYQSHTNGTNAPTGTWSTSIPSVTQGYYLWTRTVITYTDNSTSTSYSVSRIGIDGDPGEDGQMLYANSNTSASTIAKTATLSTGEISSLKAGVTVTVKFTYGNTAASPTLNVNSTGAKYIALKNKTLSATNPYYWKAYDVITFVYDGTYWNIVDVSATRSRITSEGLIVGDYSGDTLGTNVLIKSDAIDIRNNSTVYASYGANTIYLGKNGTSSTIDLCNGTATMKYKLDSVWGDTFVIEGPEVLDLSSYNTVRMRSDYGGTSHASIYVQSHEESTVKGLVQLYAYDSTSSEERITMQYNHVKISATTPNHNVAITITPNTDTVSITGASLNVSGAIKTSSVATTRSNLEVWGYAFVGSDTTYPGLVRPNGTDTGYVRTPQSGIIPYKTGGHGTVGTSSWPFTNGYFQNLYAQTKISLTKGMPLVSPNSSGTDINLIYLNTSDYLQIGSSVAASAPTNIYISNTTDSLRLYPSGSSTGCNTYFRPNTKGTCSCGTSTYYWYGVYTKNFSQDLSDGRKKENITPLGQSATSTYSLRNTIDIHSELFDRLKPVQYTHMDDDGRICYGLIAQDVTESLLELGFEENELDLVRHEYYIDEETNEEEDTYSIAYTNLIAMLIHEVQKLKSRVDELENS